jgi:hypothetical protein
MRRARDTVPDAELVLRVGRRPNGDPPHGVRRLVVRKNQRVALILVRDLIEGLNETNPALTARTSPLNWIVSGAAVPGSQLGDATARGPEYAALRVVGLARRCLTRPVTPQPLRVRGRRLRVPASGSRRVRRCSRCRRLRRLISRWTSGPCGCPLRPHEGLPLRLRCFAASEAPLRPRTLGCFPRTRRLCLPPFRPLSHGGAP